MGACPPALAGGLRGRCPIGVVARQARESLRGEAFDGYGADSRAPAARLSSGRPQRGAIRRPRARRRRTYDAAVAAAWIELWKLLDCPCGRRLPPERRRLRLDQRRDRSLRRLLWEQIPVKMAEEWDRRQGGQPASGLGAPLWPVDRGPFPGDAVHGGHRHPLVGGRAGDGSQRSAVEGRGRRTIGAGSSRRTGPACAIWWATTG